MADTNLGDDQKHKEIQSDDLYSSGNSSVSGSTPDPESDDDTLNAAQDMGLYGNQDDEHPGELGIDLEINKSEIGHQKNS